MKIHHKISRGGQIKQSPKVRGAINVPTRKIEKKVEEIEQKSSKRVKKTKGNLKKDTKKLTKLHKKQNKASVNSI